MNFSVISIRTLDSAVLVLIDDGLSPDHLDPPAQYKLLAFVPEDSLNPESAYTSYVIEYNKSHIEAPPGSKTPTEVWTTFYSMEVNAATLEYYIETQLSWNSSVNGKSGSGVDDTYLLHVADRLRVGTLQSLIASHSADAEDLYTTAGTTNQSLAIVSRSIKMNLLSSLSRYLFRVTNYDDYSTTLQAVDLLWYKSQTPLEYQTVENFVADSDCKGMIIYGMDVIMGFQTLIARIGLDVIVLKPLKRSTVAVNNLKYIDAQVTEGHLDVLYILETNSPIPLDNNRIFRIRWDNFDFPFTLPIQFSEEAFVATKNLSSLQISSRMIAVSQEDSNTLQRDILLFRGDDTFIFSEFETITSITNNQFYVSENGLTLVIVEPDKIRITALRESAYLKVSNPVTDTILVTAKWGPNEHLNTATIEFLLFVWDSPNVLNTQTIAYESDYLDESLSSDLPFGKNIPKQWFFGQWVNLSLTCPLISSRNVSIESYNQLGQKTMSFSSDTISSKNVFYYEISPQPSSDGSFLLTMQLSLQVYFLKCLPSQLSNLRCRTIRKYSDETDMIIEGKLIRDDYFLYLTVQGTYLLSINMFDSRSHLLAHGESTCSFLPYANKDLIVCSEFSSMSLSIYQLTELGTTILLFSKPNIYSTKIETIPDSQYLFLLNEESIDILNLNSLRLVSTIKSNITSQSDKEFKVCSNVLLISSPSLNSFEQYDISDVLNITPIHPLVDLSKQGYRLLSGVTTKFETICQGSWPFVVADRSSNTWAIFINVGQPINNLFSTKIPLGKSNYLVNYFLSAMSMLSSITRPRIVWSFLDTSGSFNDKWIGTEFEVFKDYRLSIELQELEKLGNSNLSCTVKVTNSQPQSIQIPFSLEVNLFSPDLSAANQQATVQSKPIEFNLDFLNSNTTANISNLFTGQPLTYYYSVSDIDYNSSIKFYEMINSDDRFSKLVKCSRADTQILDFFVSKRLSFHVLTQNAVYKIKNATDYFVQSYMMFTNTASDGAETLCKKILLNEDNNLMINICNQAGVPYFLLSNWNSLKPGIVAQVQLSGFKDMESIRYSFLSKNQIYIFSYSQMNQLKKMTTYQRYTLMNATSLNVPLSIVPAENTVLSPMIDKDFLFLSSYTCTNCSKGIRFVSVTGSNLFPESTYIELFEDALPNNPYDVIKESSLKTILNVTLSSILGKAYSTYFSRILNLYCKYVDKPQNQYVACAIIQERNIHYIVELTNTGVKLRSVFMNYANQVPAGPVDFDDTYLAMASIRMVMTEDAAAGATPLSKYYVLLYNITTSSVNIDIPNQDYNLLKVASGLPLSSAKVDLASLKLQILTVISTPYLFLISKSYYPFQSYRLESENLVRVFKSVQDKNLVISAVNHYSAATIQYKIVDWFLRLMLILLGLMLLLILCIIVATCIFGKNKKRNSTNLTGALAAAGNLVDMSNSYDGSDSEDGNEPRRSMRSFVFGQTNAPKPKSVVHQDRKSLMAPGHDNSKDEQIAERVHARTGDLSNLAALIPNNEQSMPVFKSQVDKPEPGSPKLPNEDEML